MDNQCNDLISLDWLMPLFDEELMALHWQWQEYQTSVGSFPDVSKSYHQLANVMEISNLTGFSYLATALSDLAEYGRQQQWSIDNELSGSNEQQLNLTQLLLVLSQKSKTANELLLHELNNYCIKGNFQRQLIWAITFDIYKILPDSPNKQRIEVITPVLENESNLITVGRGDNDNNKNENQTSHESHDAILALNSQIAIPTNTTLVKLGKQEEKTLLKAWRYHVNKLMTGNHNDAESLMQLHKVADYIQRSDDMPASQRLWYLVGLWLKSLVNHSQPKPDVYGYVFSDIEKFLHQCYASNANNQAVDGNDVTHTSDTYLTIEALTCAVYSQLIQLPEQTEQAKALVESLHGESPKDVGFFTRILERLEMLIFNFSHESSQYLVDELAKIKKQLSRRGWILYGASIDQILEDVCLTLTDPDLFGQLQWQIERQLQDLYGSIFNTQQAINEKIGTGAEIYTQSGTDDELAKTDAKNTQQNSAVNVNTQLNEKDRLRRVRIHIEDVKQQFSEYLRVNHIDSLPQSSIFDEIMTDLAQMELEEVTQIAADLKALIVSLSDNQLHKINWSLADALADALAEFELFLDYLAQQTLDQQRLENCRQRIEDAQGFIAQLIDQTIEAPATASDKDDKQTDVLRYDDSGEVVPSMASSTGDTAVESDTEQGFVAINDLNNSLLIDTSIEKVQVNSVSPSEPKSEDESIESEADHAMLSEEYLAAKATLKDDEFEMDLDIREIFIEEADEVLEQMDEYLPVWQSDPQDFTPLTEIRRGFHTLKGSGRMVGAYNAGEMAWAVENMLNRVLDNTLPVTDELVGFIADTKALIPTLVEDFANEQQPSIDPAITVLKAHNILAKRPIDTGLVVASSAVDLTEDQVSDQSVNAPVVDASADTVETDAVENIDTSDGVFLDDNNDDDYDLDGIDLNNIHDDAFIDSEDADSSVASQPVILSDGADDAVNESDIAPISSVQSQNLQQSDVAKSGISVPLVDIRLDGFEAPPVLEAYWSDAQNIPVDEEYADADIKEIFIEEAQEVLETISPHFQSWKKNQEDFDALTEIRRGFHTLKGSGRMVSANHTAELAWSIENMLNRVLDHTVAVDAGIVELTGDVIDSYPKMIEVFESEGEHSYPEIIPVWVACANAYGKKQGEEFDYRHIKQALQQLNQANTTDDTAADAALMDNAPVTDDSKLIESGTEDNVLLGSLDEIDMSTDAPAFDANIDTEQQEFIDIFLEEAKERLSQISRFVSKHKNDDDVEVSDEIVRSFHTLRGASGADALTGISQVSASVEQSLVQLQQNEAKMTSSHIKALEHSVNLIHGYVESYELAREQSQTGELSPTQSDDKRNVGVTDSDDTTNINDSADAEMAVINALLDNGEQTANTAGSVQLDCSVLVDESIDDVLDAEWIIPERLIDTSDDSVSMYAELMIPQLLILKARTVTSTKFQHITQALLSVYQKLKSDPKTAKESSVVPALLAGHEQLINLFDSLAASMSLKLDEQVLNDLKAIAKPPEKAALLEFETLDTDEELLDIFLEEAQELETTITQTFTKWRKNPTDIDTLKSLQRYLHTIKGGARMSGISSVGDLTHQMETIYENFVRGQLAPSEHWLGVMQTAQDVLSSQIEYVNQHRQSFYVPEVIKQLEDFEAMKTLPETANLIAPVIDSPVVEDVESASVSAPVVSETSVNNEQTEAVNNMQTVINDSWHGVLPDPDILMVFLDEADELVESSSQHLQAFRSNSSNVSIIKLLQRELHTIKGGARMVGANGLADLSHQMETVYEELADRRRPATRMVLKLLAACHDWLASAVLLLKHQYNSPVPHELIDALILFSRNPDQLDTVPVVSLQDTIDALYEHEEQQKVLLRGTHDVSQMPPMCGSFDDSQSHSTGASASNSNEMIRVSAGLMEQMINLTGESAINRARIEMGMTSLTNSIEEMGITVQRLADQLRRMDIELEAQVLSQIDDDVLLENEDFDPLEMDQYSSLNQLSKSLSESASDLLEIKTSLIEKARDSENLLLQLSRTQNELQDGLMNSRMVPFSRLSPRLQRIVRQTANELGKTVELTILNADDEMDRNILERITSPLEHMLRNAVDHGVESTKEREKLGKNRIGRVTLEVLREGGEIVINLNDDGSGINVESVRTKAIAQGLIDPNDDSLTDVDVMQYIFNAGLSTTKKVTQISGRGVGMDVVRSEIRQLGGTVVVDSTIGEGTRFTMRVPLTVAVSDALIVRAADRHYAIPLVQIERVVQVNPEKLFEFYQSDKHTFAIDGADYRLRYLNEILTGITHNDLTISSSTTLPVIIIKNQAGQSLAMQVDEIAGSRMEVVVKPLGRQLSHLAGISAATIMGDGSVMLILDLMALMRNAPVRTIAASKSRLENVRTKILVVDDSVTVRKVTSRFLERYGYDAHVAKDGVDAIETLQEFTPDLILLDIEMPRMDGFEVATQVRHNARLKHTPIIMITSRTGEKHRQRALDIGVNDYMGKPFQENELLSKIEKILGKESSVQHEK